jgi:lysozyme
MMAYDRGVMRAELERDEGLRLKVYRCTAGKQTIGIGRNLDDVGIRPVEARQLGITTATCIAKGITREQAYELLDHDIAACELALDGSLSWWRGLDGVRQRVLLNMCFNLGIRSLCGFKNTLAAVKERRFSDAVAGMKASAWHNQVGARALRLEAMMATGRA